MTPLTTNKKKYVVLALFAASLLGIAAFLHHSLFLKALLAKYKSTDQFITLAEDSRIRYEEDARTHAVALEKVLQTSQKSVETILHAHFARPVEAYVCATQDSFNEYVFLSKNVKGAVYWGKLFLSPGAFRQGQTVLLELTSHELTHYLFFTHLGEKAHIERVPLWFREGIAVFVANGGAQYTKGRDVLDVISSTERQAYLSGDMDFWFASKDPVDALRKNGTANWLVYRGGGLLVHYMHDTQTDAFEKLIPMLLAGAEFNQAVETAYGKNMESIRKAFHQHMTGNN